MEGYLDHDGDRTWYRVVGDLDPAAERAPAIVCHGGPGATHDYVEPIAELHRSGRACVLYRTMNGPTEFTVVGTIRDFDVTDRLGEIEVPVLLVSGAYDEVRPHVVAKLHDRLRDSRWELFEQSSHLPHVEEPERFLELVEGFLAQVERAG
jgi:pimeloyl-ACP methyl ester carboxylesterase